MKKFFGVLLATIIFGITTSVSYADIFDDSKVKVSYNGVEQKFNPNAVIWNNYTLVPFRQVFELYGAEVTWDQETKTVEATKGDTIITIRTPGKIAYINGEKVELAQGPINAKGTVLVGLRFVSEALGAEVSFDKKNLTVNINTQ